MVRVVPKSKGRMTVTDDATRIAFEVAGRFDFNPQSDDFDKRGRSSTDLSFSAQFPTVSIAREDLNWEPKQGDQIVRIEHDDETFSITRLADGLPAVALFVLSRGS